MEELVCRRSRGPEVDVSRIIIAAMGAMAALSPKDFKAFLGGDSAPLKARLPRCILESESAGIRAFCRDARQAVTSLRAARQWCAERLHEILSNRLPAGKREAEALIPLMRLAGPAIFDSDPDRGWDGQLIARYRHGLAEVVRHAAHLVVSAPSPMERWHAHLIDCLLGARDLGIPPWCQKLFRHATGSVGGTPTTDGDPDAIRRVLDGADLRRDALEHWVDPSAPISACTVALWLGRYLKLDVAGLHALDAVVPPGPQSALTRLVLAIVAQRLAAVASELDGQPTESPGFTQEIEDLLLHMISEVAYHDGRVPRRLRIGWLLRQAERYEITLYSLGGYRDHLYHVINVASLGILLDDMKLLASGKSHRLRGQALGDWLLAGLCHDLGYGLRPLLRGAHDLEPFLRAGLDHSLCDAIGSSIRDFLRQANDDAQVDAAIATHVGDTFDHGIMSHACLKQQVDGLVPEDLPPGRTDGFAVPLKAIAKHNLKDEPLDFKDEPISALLVLCDELQDWGRPRWDADALVSEVLGLLHFGHDRMHEPQRMCQSIRLSDQRTDPKGSPCTLTMDYTDPIANRYDPWTMVVCKLAALQRLSHLPDITLVLRLPLSPKWLRVDAEFSFRGIMRRFVASRFHPILRQSVLWPGPTADPPVRWDVSGDGAHDIITVRLDSVSAFRPVIGSVDQFLDEFPAFWRKFLADRGLGYGRP